MVEFNLVLENSRLKEDIGIEQLHFSKCTFNMLSIEYYRESLDSNGDPEPYTTIVTDTGLLLCLDVEYKDFDKLYKNVINEDEQ